MNESTCCSFKLEVHSMRLVATGASINRESQSGIWIGTLWSRVGQMTSDKVHAHTHTWTVCSTLQVPENKQRKTVFQADFRLVKWVSGLCSLEVYKNELFFCFVFFNRFLFWTVNNESTHSSQHRQFFPLARHSECQTRGTVCLLKVD